MKNTLKAALFASACSVLYGQTIYTTTLSTALPTSPTSFVCLASSTGVRTPSPLGAASILFIESETLQVIRNAPVAGCYLVRRGVLGTTPASHASGVMVSINGPSGPTQGGTNAIAGGTGGSGGGSYTLPPATASALGGVKQGSGNTIAADGTLTVTASGSGAPATIKYVSQLVDVTTIRCNVNTGIKSTGGRCVDAGTAALAAFVQSGTATRPVHLINDVGIGTTGINAGTNGYAKISCLPGAGFFVVDGSNSSAIYTGRSNIVDSLALPGTQGSNFEVSGCIINGNRNSTLLLSSPNFPLTNSTSSDPHGNNADPTALFGFYWCMGVHVLNMQNVRITGNTFIDIPAYSMIFDNVQHAAIQDNRVVTYSFIFNQDAMHLNGFNSDFDISGNSGNMGDDYLAINPAEGYVSVGQTGNVTDIRVSNENIVDSWNGMRLYTSAAGIPGHANQINNIVLSNIVGHARNSFIKFGGEGTDPVVTNQIGIISVNNSNFRADGNAFLLWESAKLLNINGLTMGGSGLPLFDAVNTTGNLQKLNIVSLDPGQSSAVAGSSDASQASPTAAIKSVVGPGVLNTGLKFSDSSLGDNTVFLSDGSSVCAAGALCWRSAGTSQQILASSALSGPIEKWLLNEGAGTTFADSSGHPNTFTGSGVTFSTVAGIPGQAVTFTASTPTRLTAANAAATNLGTTSNPFSVSVWAKNTIQGTLQVITGNQASNVGFYIAKQTDNQVYVQLVQVGGALINKKFNYALSTTSVDNLIVTYDGSASAAGMKLYANGVLQTQNTLTSDTLTAGTSVNSGNPWYISGLPGFAFDFSGYVADLKIWSRVVTSGEISSLFAGGAQ